MPGHALHRLDAMTAAPGHHDVLMENDRVRVIDNRLGGSAEPDPKAGEAFSGTGGAVASSDRVINRGFDARRDPGI